VAACRTLVEDSVAAFGTVDILVNCAGIFIPSLTHEVDEDIWDQYMAANLKSCFFCTQAALPHMLAKGRGRVVNISSVGDAIGLPNCAVYCASKGGISAMTRAWALEFASRGVAVNAISPGAVETGMNEDIRSQEGSSEFFRSASPIGRWGAPREVAPAAVFLGSDDADFIHGTTIYVDGGWVIQ
jgi:NAD(P)-dependent dehydrogenase (short-subunit alcohol dehydrogenase family)